MIEAVQEWLRAVVVTALLLSVVQTLLPEGNVRRIASFSGGLILMLVLLRPLLGTDLSALELDLAPYREAIEERQAELEAESDQELEQLIAERRAHIYWKKRPGWACRFRCGWRPRPETTVCRFR